MHEKQLDETDYRDLILKEYTFLQRPVVVTDNDIFIGNAAKTIAAAKVLLERLARFGQYPYLPKRHNPVAMIKPFPSPAPEKASRATRFCEMLDSGSQMGGDRISG